MFDIITLGLLWLMTAGVSGLTYWTGAWPGGVYWFWLWNTVTLAVGAYEAYLYFKFGMTLTRLIKQAGKDKPLVMRHVWMARLIVVGYGVGALSLCVHLWPK